MSTEHDGWDDQTGSRATLAYQVEGLREQLMEAEDRAAEALDMAHEAAQEALEWRRAFLTGRRSPDASRRHWRPLAARLRAEFKDCPALAVQMLAGCIDREVQETLALGLGLAQRGQEPPQTVAELAQALIAEAAP